MVLDVRIVGNRAVDSSKVPKPATRKGQPLDPELLEEDKRTFAATGKFLDVQPKIQEVAGGVVVFFEVVERPLIGQVKYLGNKKVSEKALAKQTLLERGAPLDPYAVEDGRRKIEQYYRDRGHNDVEVEIAEGNKVGDDEVVYLISEGYSEKVWWTGFEGNTIVNDARLRTQIQTKPGFVWLFKGYVDEKKLAEDKDRLINYYHSLGYFQVQVSREVEGTGRWRKVTFVINEGPRYYVRNIKFIGNEKFSTDLLAEDLKLRPGMAFDKVAMTKDTLVIKDIYGSQGYVHAEVKPEPILDLEPGNLDLEYRIVEREQYRVGRIYVTITGDNPRTRESVVRNRLSLKTGDIVDTRKLRDSERRLKASGLFLTDPLTGTAPKIAVLGDEKDGELVSKPKKKPSNFRSQSPDDDAQHGVRDVHLFYQSREQFQADHPEATVEPNSSAPAAQPMHPVQQWHPRQAVPHLLPSTMQRQHVPQHAPRPSYVPQPQGVPSHQYNPRSQPAPAQQHAPIIRGQSPGYFQQPVQRAQNPYGQNQNFGGQPVGAVGPESRPVPVSQPARPGRQQAFRAPNENQITPVQYTQPAPGYQPGQVYFNQQAPAAGPMQQPFAPAPAPGGPPTIPLQMPPPVNESGDVDYQLVPQPYLDLEAQVSEAPTGRIMFGVGINSDAGLVGNVVIDEQNFDIRALPSSWEDVRSGRAFRGAGQRFRLEAAPGTEVQRYVASFTEPYLFDTPVGYSISASYYERFFRDWDEERVSLRNALSYQLRPNLTLTGAVRAEEVKISDPRTPTPPELAEAVGSNEVYGFKAQLTHDTRDSPFLPTQGHLIELAFEQVIGTFDYPRETIEARQYFLMRERPDGSGRHVLSIGGQVGFSGDETPIYDHFFAGGFSTMRGFEFRGASPRSGDVIVGGEFQLLTTVEYMFPITADDMLKGVVFVDAGTVEERISIDSDDFRVAPGLGLRITVPALGPAPIALDLAFPIAKEEGDQTQVFSFNVGYAR